MSKYTKGVLITLLGGVCWGLSGTCSQYLCSVQGMDTRWVTALRLLGAGVVLLLLAAVQQREQLQKLLRDKRAVLYCVVFGVCGLLFTQFTYITSITKSNSGTATVLQYLSVVIVLFVECIAMRRLPVRREWLAMGSCLFGTFLVATHGSVTSLYISRDGLIWGFISAAAAAAYIIIPQRLMRIWTISVSFSAQSVVMTIFVVLVGTALAFTAFLQGTAIVGPARGNMLGCVEPLTATLTTALFMHTAFAGMDLIGFAFILATVFILAKKA